jgi:hypothetical protein
MAAKANPPARTTNAPEIFARMLSQMEIEATSGDDDFGSPMITGVVGILEAETEEEMWDADDLDQTGGRDLVDVEQQIIAYAVKYSTNPTISSVFKDSNGRGMYLLIRSVRVEDGSEFVWNTSAPLLVGKIMWLVNREMLPAYVVIRAKELGADQKILRLKPMPRRAVQEPAF